MSSKTDQQYGIKVLADGIDPAADLVAVHGLDGHREDTWTAKNGVLWLRDCLPKLLPNVRILSYGYDARTHGSTPLSCQNLHDHGISLVTELTLHRTETKTSDRPIIFIAHDIGGVIVKDALIHSNAANKDNLEHHSSIKTSSYGILFFGTPHQGSDTLACPPNILAFLEKTNNKISKNLSGGSELLQKQLGQYNHISSSFVTKCFYETNRSSSGKELVVSTSSAIIPGATNVEIFAINSDHKGMVKYKSAEDSGFKKVAACLESMVNDAPQKVLGNWERWNRIKAAERNDIQITFEIPFEPQYLRNPHFTGRKDLLAKLHQAIERGHSPLASRQDVLAKPHQVIERGHSTLAIAVLYGTGGIGKTQIASEYTHAYQKEYKSIFWINAATKESIERGFRATAQRLVKEQAKVSYDVNPNYNLIAKSLNMVGVVAEDGSISPHQDDMDCILRGVKLWLAKEGNQNWLLVFDNVDDLDNSAIETFVPTASQGTIIMTSRRTECGAFGIGFRVEEMLEQEAMELLLKSAALELEDNSIAGDVVRKLGCLPLAVVQAGAYVGVRQMPFTRYLEIYEKYFSKVSAEKPSKATWSYEKTVWTTWEISFQAIKETDAGAAELLSLCSFISNEDIWDDMIRKSKDLARDDITLDDSLRLLFSYSLAQRKGRNGSFYIHPVVHLWAHERLEEPERVRKTKEAMQLLASGEGNFGFETTNELKYESKILPHMIATAGFIKKYLETTLLDQALLTRMNYIGMVFNRTGRFQDAEVIQLQTIEAAQDIIGKEDPYTLVLMGNLASTYSDQSRSKEAEGLGLQVLEKLRSVRGKKHPDTLTAMSNLARTYCNQGRYKEAENLELQVLEGRRSVLGKDHPETLCAMNNLALTYSCQGRYKEAEKLELQVLEKHRSVLGEDHPKTLTVMNNLASTYSNQGRYTEAETLTLPIIEAYQSTQGKEHPENLVLMNNLASTHFEKGRYKEAEELSLKAVEASQSMLGRDHPSTLGTMGSLAGIYSEQGRYEEAVALQAAVIEGNQNVLGMKHPDTLTSMHNLACYYSDQGHYDKAEALEVAVIEARQHVLGNDHPQTLQAMSDLEKLYQHQGRYNEAEEIGLQVLGARQNVLGMEDPATLHTLASLALTYKQQGRTKEADELIVQLFEGMEKIVEKDPQQIQHVVDKLEAIQSGLRMGVGSEMLDGKLARVKGAAQITRSFLGGQKGGLKELIKMSGRRDEQQNAAAGSSGAMVQSMSLLSGNLSNGNSGGEVFPENDSNPLTLVNNLALALGETHIETISAMSSLAGDLSAHGRWKEAEELELRVVKSAQETYGKEDIMTLRAMTNSAITYMRQGRLKDAEQLQLQVVECMNRTQEKSHFDAMQTTQLLAVIYSKQGRWKEAAELVEGLSDREDDLLNEVIAMSLRTDNPGESSTNGRRLDKNRPDHLKTMANEAATYWDLGQWREAEELEVKVMRSRQRSEGGEDPSTLLVMANLAATYRDQERWKEAEVLELQVVETRKRVLSNDHPDTLTAMANLAGTYADQGKWKLAEELYLELVKVRAKSLGKEHPKTLSAMARLATNFWHQGELHKAEKIELKVVQSRRRIFGNEDLETLTAVGNLAATYASQDRYNEAETLQHEVHRGLARTRGYRHSETVLAQELVELYRQGNMKQQKTKLVREQGVIELFGGDGNKTMGSFLVFMLFLTSFFVSLSYRLSLYLISSLPFSSLFGMYSREAIMERYRELAERVADITGRSGVQSER